MLTNLIHPPLMIWFYQFIGADSNTKVPYHQMLGITIHWIRELSSVGPVGRISYDAGWNFASFQGESSLRPHFWHSGAKQPLAKKIGFSAAQRNKDCPTSQLELFLCKLPCAWIREIILLILPPHVTQHSTLFSDQHMECTETPKLTWNGPACKPVLSFSIFKWPNNAYTPGEKMVSVGFFTSCPLWPQRKILQRCMVPSYALPP